MSQSPLTTSEPKSLDDIFSQDPLTHSQEDLDRIVQYMRDWRQKYKGEKKAGKKNQSAGQSAKKEAEGQQGSLEELGGLDLDGI